MSDLTIVEWRAVPGFPEFEISEDGRLRRTVRNRRNHKLRELRGSVSAEGYHAFVLYLDGEPFHFGAHALVALTFIGPRPSPQHEVAHWDGDPSNNRVGNLRWATPKENADDRRRHGRNLIGEKHPMHRLTGDDVLAIFRAAKNGEKQRSIAKKFGINQGYLTKILNRKFWQNIEIPSDLQYVAPPYIGERHPLGKLNPEKVRIARRLISQHVSLTEIGDQLGVHRGTIQAIRDGLTWKHVPHEMQPPPCYAADLYAGERAKARAA